MSDANPTNASAVNKHSAPNRQSSDSFASVRSFLLAELTHDLNEQRAYLCTGCSTGCLNPVDSVPARFEHCVDCVASLWVNGSVRPRSWGEGE